jgi:Fe2+ transport system protein FeoA
LTASKKVPAKIEFMTFYDIINPGDEFMLLSEMKEKQTARIVRVGGNGALRRRILEMGILKGSEIYVEKYAPLRDPVELIVKGYHISLRVEEAAQITVEHIKQKNHNASKTPFHRPCRQP